MTDIWQLREGERLDDLVRDGMKIIQRTDQFCFSMDSVLLAHYVNIRAKDRIVDLGTGTGVIALLLSALGAGILQRWKSIRLWRNWLREMWKGITGKIIFR